jgi:radical SAM superfamily enzyme YgiQ (UPF0313 family)
MRRVPSEPRIAFLQPGQLVPRAAKDFLHSFNVSTTALAILGALRDGGYGDLHFYDVACEDGDRLGDWNAALYYKGATDATVEAWLRTTAPDVVCLTSMFTCDFPATDHMASLIKRALPDSTLIVGGRHASLMPHWHLANPAVDWLVQGEGEQTIVRLLHALAGRSPANPTRIPGVFTMATMDPAAPRAWPEAELGGSFAQDLVLWKPDGQFRYREVVLHESPKDFLYKRAATALHSTPLMPTRGCPLACRFCGSHFTPEMRPVGVERILADLHYAFERGVRIFYNISENFCLHEKDRELLRLMADWRDQLGGEFILTHPNSTFLPVYMDGTVPADAFIDLCVRAGTDLVTISVETFSPRFDDKKLFKKYTIPQVEALWRRFRQAGLKVHLYMMTGFPDETVDELMHDVAQVRDWVGRGLVDAASFSNLLYLPGTAYYRHALKQGWFDEATFRGWIEQGFNFFAVPERLNFSRVPTPVLRDVLACLRVADYDGALRAGQAAQGEPVQVAQ